MFVRLCLFIIPVVFLAFSRAWAQDAGIYKLSTDSAVNKYASSNRVYQTEHTGTRPKIDGKIDDVCWETARWDGSFIQQ